MWHELHERVWEEGKTLPRDNPYSFFRKLQKVRLQVRFFAFLNDGHRPLKRRANPTGGKPMQGKPTEGLLCDAHVAYWLLATLISHQSRHVELLIFCRASAVGCIALPSTGLHGPDESVDGNCNADETHNGFRISRLDTVMPSLICLFYLLHACAAFEIRPKHKKGMENSIRVPAGR